LMTTVQETLISMNLLKLLKTSRFKLKKLISRVCSNPWI
jgi:hypothetical protein